MTYQGVQPGSDNFTPGFLRQRRNLLLCTILMAVMNMGIFKLKGVSLSGLGLELLNEQRLHWLVLALELYFLLRFFAYRKRYEGNAAKFPESYSEAILKSSQAITGRCAVFFNKSDNSWKYSLLAKGHKFSGTNNVAEKVKEPLPKTGVWLVFIIGWAFWLPVM